MHSFKIKVNLKGNNLYFYNLYSKLFSPIHKMSEILITMFNRKEKDK